MTTTSTATLATDQKALAINLDSKLYGTFAEIGAGQEVARNFFKVGGAAGTVAKSMSAYDMKVSDDIYGKTERYVSYDRLMSMLNHEYTLLTERLTETRGKESTFFVFADTVSARNFKGTNECHGWMGVRFQTTPGGESNDVIIHVSMKDKENVLQQKALGIIGVNLLYATFFHRHDPHGFIQSLLDNLSIDRLEVDLIRVSGKDLAHVDVRILNLKLLEYGLTNAVLFGPEQQVLQPSEILRKKPVLIERGSFKPITHVQTDMLTCAAKQFEVEPEVVGKEIVTLFEITLSNLLSSGSIDLQDFIARTETVSALGYKVLVTNYPEFYRLPEYLRRFTQERIGVVLGLNNLLRVVDERYYKDLEGGILEAFGKLFHNRLTLYVYPMSKEGYKNFLLDEHLAVDMVDLPANSVISATDIHVMEKQRFLYQHLIENRHIVSITSFNRSCLDIFPRDVLEMIKNGDDQWLAAVPTAAAQVIKERGMFGYQSK